MTLAAGSEFEKLLEDVPIRAMRRRLVRCVAALDFLDGSPPRYLYTSGRPGRCNPRDVDCLYFSETERVADLEYRRRFAGVGTATEPRLTFFAQVDLKHVVDLARPAVLRTLGISADEILAPWRSASSPTRLQGLGLAVSRQRRVSAIRFASDACRRAGTKGWNVAIFPGAIVAPGHGVSLNQFMAAALAEKGGVIETARVLGTACRRSTHHRGISANTPQPRYSRV